MSTELNTYFIRYVTGHEYVKKKLKQGPISKLLGKSSHINIFYMNIKLKSSFLDRKRIIHLQIVKCKSIILPFQVFCNAFTYCFPFF